jgi:ATP-binding cassette, subfamily F, member 3
MSLLNVSDLSFYHSQDAPLFSGVSFEIDPGERIGLAGRNGSGKTTLLRLIAGEIEPTGGAIASRRGLNLAYLAQNAAVGGPETLFDAVFSRNPQLAELRGQIIGLEDNARDDTAAARYAELICQYQEAGGYRFEAEVERVLEGLGFEPSAREKPLAQLSGGERVRAALARCLLSAADLVLLDEPTNHLDVATREWLEDYLAGLTAACVVVSHDRVFLNRATRRTLALERGRLTDCAGNYDFYRAERALRERQAWEQYEGQQRRAAAAERAAEQRARLSVKVATPPNGEHGSRDFYRRKAAKVARTGRILRERQMLEEPAEKPWSEQPIPKLDFVNVPGSGNSVLRADRLTKTFGPKALFEDLSLHIRRGERWTILGPNGSGKTTLLRILAGQIQPDFGELHIGQQVKIGYYAQETENLDPSWTAIETCRHATNDEAAARTLLGCWKLPAERVTRPIATLSAGERAKVALARLLLSEVNLLLLDEPTNHLEIEAIEALLATLHQFPGTIVFVSHDRHLIETLGHQSLRLCN